MKNTSKLKSPIENKKPNLLILIKNRTPFTGVDRYNYVDEEYAYTNEEIKKIEKQKLLYRKYIEDLQYYRAEKLRIKYREIYFS
jgi:hypothetical protein